jgi:hypothetical protein
MAFPTETLLITGGTRDADLAARPAWDLADQSGAETYLLYGHRLVMLGLGVERCLHHRDPLDGLV